MLDRDVKRIPQIVDRILNKGDMMPMAGYKCSKCDNYFRELDGDKWEVCPECGSLTERKYPPRIVTRYKGDGFYSTRDEKDES